MVMAHENPGNATTFVLQVNADQMTGLYGAGFDLTYPTAQLSYVSAEEGPFLNADGSPTSLQVTETAPGTLVVGVTRLGNISGASGSATVVRFVFAVQSAGTGSLLFTNTSAFGPNGAARGDIGWFGGSVRVIR
jgi:general secretion pathway protein D